MQAIQSSAAAATSAGRSAADDTTAKPGEASQASAWQNDADKREAMIRLVAYSFYERRGFVEGDELADWLQAEMEVDRQLAAQSEPDKAR